MIALGAVSVPRGSDSTPSEINFIYRHSDSSYLIFENNEQIRSLLDVFTKEDWDSCRQIFIMDNDEGDALPEYILRKSVYYNELLKLEKENLRKILS